VVTGSVVTGSVAPDVLATSGAELLSDVAMVFVWTHPACQHRLAVPWRTRDGPIDAANVGCVPILSLCWLMLSCACPVWAGARSLHGYLRSWASGARIVRTSLSMTGLWRMARRGGWKAGRPSRLVRGLLRWKTVCGATITKWYRRCLRH